MDLAANVFMDLSDVSAELLLWETVMKGMLDRDGPRITCIDDLASSA